MSVETVRPVPPENPYDARRLEHCRFELDRTAGVVRWYADTRGGAEPVVLALPGSGAAAPELRTIVFARYAFPDTASVLTPNPRFDRMWLVDSTGRVVGRSGAMRQRRDTFPDAVLAPLTDLGVEVKDQRFDSVYAAKSAYVDAVPNWVWGARRTLFPIVVVATILLVVILVAIVTLV